MEGPREQERFQGRAALERWLLACASAVVYYALSGAAASPIRPAAGFALAATAMWGPSAAIGVFLGALLADERPFPAGPGPALSAAAAAAILAGLGAAAQAFMGAALLRKDGSAADSPRTTKDAAYFCVTAPMIALIGPAFDLLALAVNGTPPAFDWARTGLAWWLADAAGLLVVAPLILAWARPRESAGFGPRPATAAVAAFAAAVAWLSPGDARMGASAVLAGLAAAVLLARALFDERADATQELSADALAARERLDMNRRLFDNLPVGILILRLEKAGDAGTLRIVDINPAGRALSGAGDAPVAGMPMREFSPEFHETGLAAECLAVLKTGKSRVISELLSTRKVPGAYFNLTLFSLSEREIVIAFENVTEQKKARQMLQDNAQLLLLMIESVREYAIFRVDQAGRVSSWSRGAEIIYGYSPVEILGSPYARLLPADSGPQRQLKEVARDGRLKAESWCVRKNGGRFWADIVLTALRDEAGASLGCVAVVRDATQRRASAQVLERRAADLSRSNLELSQFAYVASHDLSAPLHKVKAFADRLKDKLEGKLDEEGRDYLRRMLRAVDGMQSLIDALLELARVSTRGAAAEEVDLGALVKDVVESLDHAVARSRARVEIGALPRINADPLQMRQLLQNLISNALKFHKPGSSPRVRIHGRATGDGRCELVVADNGIGFDMKFAERIFQPFQRLQASPEYEGTGMGLAICRKIAARHGGTISASSEPGRGSEFKVVLPISQEGRMECQPQEKALS